MNKVWETGRLTMEPNVRYNSVKNAVLYGLEYNTPTRPIDIKLNIFQPINDNW